MRSLGIIVAFGLLFSFIVQTKAEALEGVRAFKPVLEGTLYRGGGAGGKKPLSSKALQALCEEGFSSAIYLYSTGFKGDETVECKTKSGSNNRLKYTSMSFRSERKDILEKVYEVATNSSLGPIFVHCWNGKHAAGEISAIALKQFCDYSSDAAASYWKKNIDDNPNDYTSIWKKHIPGFKADRRFENLEFDSKGSLPLSLRLRHRPNFKADCVNFARAYGRLLATWKRRQQI